MRFIFKFSFLVSLLILLSSCGGLSIENHQVESLGLRSIIGMQEKWTVSGTIRNNSSSTCSNITLKIRYLDSANNEKGEELLPLSGIAIAPNSVGRFKSKTNHAPKVDNLKYKISIDSYSN